MRVCHVANTLNTESEERESVTEEEVVPSSRVEPEETVYQPFQEEFQAYEEKGRAVKITK